MTICLKSRTTKFSSVTQYSTNCCVSSYTMINLSNRLSVVASDITCFTINVKVVNWKLKSRNSFFQDSDEYVLSLFLRKTWYAECNPIIIKQFCKWFYFLVTCYIILDSILFLLLLKKRQMASVYLGRGWMSIV